MAVGMPESLDYYNDNAKDMMFAKYQYVLKSYEDEDGKEIHTDNKDAEKRPPVAFLKEIFLDSRSSLKTFPKFFILLPLIYFSYFTTFPNKY